MLLLVQLPPSAAIGILAALTGLALAALALRAIAKAVAQAVAQDERD